MKNSVHGFNFRGGSRSNLNIIAGLCARGVRKECGKLTRTISLVKLQGNWGYCSSPLMKSSSLSHNMMASKEDFLFPWPWVMWLVHTKSSIANAPGGDFELSLSTKLLDQLVLHEKLQKQFGGGHHQTLEWTQHVIHWGRRRWSPSHGQKLWRPLTWRRMWWGRRTLNPMTLTWKWRQYWRKQQIQAPNHFTPSWRFALFKNRFKWLEIGLQRTPKHIASLQLTQHQQKQDHNDEHNE